MMNQQLARQLRKNMTDPERRLWRELRYRQLDGCKFRRQTPLGNYIVDFACFERRLVVELDGEQHAEQEQEDGARTQWLNSQGFRLIRFWNHEVSEDLDLVLQIIWDVLHDTQPPTPTLPHKGGGGRGPDQGRGDELERRGEKS